MTPSGNGEERKGRHLFLVPDDTRPSQVLTISIPLHVNRPVLRHEVSDTVSQLVALVKQRHPSLHAGTAQAALTQYDPDDTGPGQLA